MSGSNFKAPAWFNDWKDKYQPILVDGLTDGPTYVRLTRKECPMLDVELAFRPFVTRVTEDKIAFVGKLSVFPVKGTVKAEPANASTMVGWLSGAFPNLEFPKKSDLRVGTVLLTIADAPMNAKKAFTEHFADSPLVDKLLDWIEEMGGFKVENRKLAARALKEAYVHWLDVVFLPGDGDSAASVGTTAEFAAGDNILPFVKKATKPKEAEGEE